MRVGGSATSTVWGDTLSGRSIDAETSRWVARGRGCRVRGMRDSGKSVAVGIGACGAADPAESPAPRRRRSRRPRRSTSPNTTYAPEEGTDGGSIIIGDWQEANQFNPYYLGQVTEANVASAAWASLVVLHPRLSLRARPRDRRPDDRQRRRQGPRRGRRRDDRDLDAPPRPQVVGRRAPHLRRLQVRVGVGPRPGQRRRRSRPATSDITRLRVRLGHRDGLALHEDLRGLHHPRRSPRCRATTCETIPIADQVNGAGFRAERDRQPAGQRRVQVRVGHAAAGAAPGQEPELHEPLRPASRPTSTTSSGSGTATPTS